MLEATTYTHWVLAFETSQHFPYFSYPSTHKQPCHTTTHPLHIAVSHLISLAPPTNCPYTPHQHKCINTGSSSTDINASYVTAPGPSLFFILALRSATVRELDPVSSYMIVCSSAPFLGMLRSGTWLVLAWMMRVGDGNGVRGGDASR